MRLKRRDDYYDWQRELAARSSSSKAVVGGEAQAAPRMRTVARRWLSLLFALFMLACVFGGIALKQIDPHPGGLAHLATLVCAIALAVNGAVALLLAIRKRVQRDRVNPALKIRQQLEAASSDVEGFLIIPPARKRYDRWMRTRGDRLARLSPELARDWARPDGAVHGTDVTVSKTELDLRRQRIRELLANA